jgi:hypothetical protein
LAFAAASAITAPAVGQEAPFRNLKACEGGAFSTEEDFMMMRGEPFDGNPYISDGDVLSPSGEVCARNAELLQRFDVRVDLGLDGLDILDLEGLVAFSTELDSPFGTFTAGDLLLTSGASIPNAALLAAFGVTYDVGLDELKFMGEIDSIRRFIDLVQQTPRDAWEGDRLPAALKEFNIDIWFSIEGTIMFRGRTILDGDVLAATGSIIATNADLLLPGAPAGIPVEGVDFGVDAFAVARDAIAQARDLSALFFSTEINHTGRATFTDGDVLAQGGFVVVTNADLVAAFNPAAKFLGLDALWFAFGRVPTDPRITTMCDLSVGEFNGGIVPVGGSGTGLHESPLASPPALIDTLGRPCGLFVPIDGFLPVPPTSVERFRVAYREGSEPVPGTIGDPTTSAVQTVWHLKRGVFKWIPMVGFQWVCELPATLATDGNGWMDAQDYFDAKNGAGTFIGCPHELRLAVWNTMALPAGTPTGDPIPAVQDREDRYAIWLEWEDSTAVMHRESVDHILQLDNTLPIIAPFPDGLQVRLTDGTTIVPNCGEAPADASQFQVWGQFHDRFYDSFSLGLKGGDPPAATGYGPHQFYDPDDGTSGVKNTDDTGTVPDSTVVRLRDISLLDLGASAVECCYLLEMYVYDRSIRHTFDGTFVNSFVGANWSYTFMTFSASP